MNEKKPSLRLALLPLLSIIGASAGVYLSRLYYGLRAGTAGFNSFCNINSTLNCDAVTSSKYAELVGGLPLSSFVTGWFIAILILSLMARVTSWRKEAVTAGAILSGFASLYSIALLVVMFGVLGKICLFCLVIDAVNFSLFAIFFTMLRGQGKINWANLKSHAFIVIGCVFVSVVLLRPSEENMRKEATNAEIEYTVKQILEKPPLTITTPATAAIIGNPNASITIHEFSDFQCPFCKRGAVLMHQLMSRYEGKIKIVFMPFPLDSSCNRKVTHAMHPFACELARAAYCANTVGKFSPFYEHTFDAQEDLKAESAMKISLAQGVPEAKYAECNSSEAAKKAVSDSIEEGIKLNVESTPTFFINGRKVEGPLPMEVWDQLIANLSK